MFFLVALCYLLSPTAPQEKMDVGLNPMQAHVSDTFPSSWEGNWEGVLHVYKGQDTLMSTPMSIDIHSRSNGEYTWLLSYGERQEDQRPYILRRPDSLDYHWVIDEQNSIILDAYLHGSVLYSRFEVMGNLLFTRDELVSDTLHHEIVSGRLVNDIRKSGNMITGNLDTIPEVSSYLLSTVQKAKLTRRL